MSVKHRSKPELRDLLTQLARFFRANENRISANHVSQSLEHLSAIEISALDRLFFLLYHNKSPGPEWTEWTLNSSSNTSINSPGRLGGAPSVARTVSLQEERSAISPGDGPDHTDRAQEHQPHLAPHPRYDQQQGSSADGNPRNSGSIDTQEHRPYFSLISGNDDDQPRLHQGACSSHTAAPTLEEIHNQNTSCLGLGDNATLHSSPNIARALPTTELVASHQAESEAPHVWVDDDVFSKTTLAMCSKVTLAPSTGRLLEDCKTNRGAFLRAIGEAKAAFPTGQGWEAAIVVKKENADIRELMKIYHRFECYNIYKHVVEAGYHTGIHWIRDMRTALVKKLCQEFPARFQHQKTANKSLNWVDQGCRYHEWAGMFSATTDLGYLIALPSDVPNSAYTSRCTKEQMDAAALKFKSLGIDDLVKRYELSELGNHIAAALREMTGKKRKNIDGFGEIVQRPRKSPRLMSGSSIPILTLQSSQNYTSPESMVAVDQHHFGHHTDYFMPNLTREHFSIHTGQDQNTNNSMMTGCAVPYDPFNTLELSSSIYSELLLSPYPTFLGPFDERNYVAN